jgi:signal recognition particle subunit SRP54
MVGVIDSMTSQERIDPSVIDARRKHRIAKGAGVETKTVSELLKNFGMMKNVMTGMAGMGATDKMKKMQELQAGAMNPGGGLPKMKKSTGKRLTPKERKKMQKEREKQMRLMRKKKKGG